MKTASTIFWGVGTPTCVRPDLHVCTCSVFPVSISIFCCKLCRCVPHFLLTMSILCWISFQSHGWTNGWNSQCQNSPWLNLPTRKPLAGLLQVSPKGHRDALVAMTARHPAFMLQLAIGKYGEIIHKWRGNAQQTVLVWDILVNILDLWDNPQPQWDSTMKNCELFNENGFLNEHLMR